MNMPQSPGSRFLFYFRNTIRSAGYGETRKYTLLYLFMCVWSHDLEQIWSSRRVRPFNNCPLMVYLALRGLHEGDIVKCSWLDCVMFIYGSFSWKLVKIVTYRVKIQSVNFLMLLFGNESLTSLVLINIRHKLTGWQELG